MSELGEAQWAVVSERGCETSGVNYTTALELMRHLTEEKVSGLCIVTAAAARRSTNGLRANRQPSPKRAAPRKA
jgi:hypothetical protein